MQSSRCIKQSEFVLLSSICTASDNDTMSCEIWRCLLSGLYS